MGARIASSIPDGGASVDGQSPAAHLRLQVDLGMTVRRQMWIPAAVFLGAIVLGVGCDYSTKARAESALSDEPNQAVSAIDPYVDLSLQHNEGTAFSFVR